MVVAIAKELRLPVLYLGRRREGRRPGGFPSPGVRLCPPRLISCAGRCASPRAAATAPPPIPWSAPSWCRAARSWGAAGTARSADRTPRSKPSARPGTALAAPPSTSPWSPAPTTAARRPAWTPCWPPASPGWWPATAIPIPASRAGASRSCARPGSRSRSGILAEEAVRLNLRFLVAATLRRPAVTLKWAMSLDGRIATATGESQWISSPRPPLGAGSARGARRHPRGERHGAGGRSAPRPAARSRRRTQRAGGPRPPPAHAARARGSSGRGPVLIYTEAAGHERADVVRVPLGRARGGARRSLRARHPERAGGRGRRGPRELRCERLLRPGDGRLRAAL